MVCDIASVFLTLYAYSIRSLCFGSGVPLGRSKTVCDSEPRKSAAVLYHLLCIAAFLPSTDQNHQQGASNGEFGDLWSW